MLIFRTKQEIRNFISQAKSQGKRIAYAPTMGALHKGHLSLIRLGKQKADIVICSIFVNPAQFGPNEDFGKYPRQEDEDVDLLESAGCDAVFLPAVTEIYQERFSTELKVTTNSDILCGAFRPGHFDGVALVVSKLFNIVTPDVAIFGEKDFQQLFIIRQLVKDLDFNVEIVGAPTIREEGGLALSSRNQYLSDEERIIAAYLNQIMRKTIEKVNSFTVKIDKALEEAKNELLKTGFTKIDYLEIRQADTLDKTLTPDSKSRIFAAAWLGKTRLIDNIALK